MATKAIFSAIAVCSLMFSASAASAAAKEPAIFVQSVSAVKAPVAGVRAKRVLKKKSRYQAETAAAAAAAAGGGGIGTVAAVAIGVAVAGAVTGVAVTVTQDASPS